jgi:hypothetical protein
MIALYALARPVISARAGCADVISLTRLLRKEEGKQVMFGMNGIETLIFLCLCALLAASVLIHVFSKDDEKKEDQDARD